MTKALAVLGIVGVVLAALLSFAVSGDAIPVVVLLFLLVSAIVLFTRRTAFTTITGIVLILLGFSALLYFNPILGTEGQVYLPELPAYFQGAWMPTLVIIACIALVLAARDEVAPAWTGYLGLAAAVLAILLVPFIPVSEQGSFTSPLGIGVAILALFLLFPLIALLRGPSAAVAPTVERSNSGTAPTVRK